MKKIIPLFIVVVLLFCACGTNNEKKKTTVVASVYPIYDWLLNLTEDTDIQAELIVKNGSDIHSFQPSVSDTVKIVDSDLFVYVGGESDKWVSDVLSAGGKKSGARETLFDMLGGRLLDEEFPEGMEQEKEEEEDGEDERAFDEHVWLSPENAIVCVRKMSEKLCEISPDDSETIRKNAEAYEKELGGLCDKIAAAKKTLGGKTAVFADRFPFRYLADGLGIKYCAPFAGCSAETEASFETVAFLKNKVDGLGADSVFVLVGNNEKLAKTIAPDAKIITLNSLESKCDKSYVQVMNENIDLISEGLAK